MDYAIRYVFDPETSELFDASVVFSTHDGGRAFREDFHNSGRKLYCRACHERATISTGRYESFFFRHFPNTPDCDLKDIEYSKAERALIEQHFGNKESIGHKTIKKAIGEYLLATPGIDPGSLNIDDQFLIEGKEKRRPDVLCSYSDKLIAFEVQLSKLPPRYIFKRHHFYKRNNIFLIWILNQFDPSDQSQREKDIKYLTRHQNFFAFDLESPSFIVNYMKGSIDRHGDVQFNWTHARVELKQLTLDEKDVQCYFSSYEKEQIQFYRQVLRSKHPGLLENLGAFFTQNDEKLIPRFHTKIESLPPLHVAVLQQALGLDRNVDLLIKAAREKKFHFLMYLLERNQFTFAFRADSSSNNTVLQIILGQEKVEFRWRLIKLLFYQGYRLTSSDKNFLHGFHFHEKSPRMRSQHLISIYAYNALGEKSHIETYEAMEGTVYTILSAKFKQIVGHGFQNFISLANNAIDNYKSAFTYIERAFIYYDLWDRILEEDKNKTFLQKYQAYRSEKRGYSESREYATLRLLFPQVFDPVRGQEFPWISLEELQAEH